MTMRNADRPSRPILKLRHNLPFLALLALGCVLTFLILNGARFAPGH